MCIIHLLFFPIYVYADVHIFYIPICIEVQLFLFAYLQLSLSPLVSHGFAAPFAGGISPSRRWKRGATARVAELCEAVRVHRKP